MTTNTSQDTIVDPSSNTVEAIVPKAKKASKKALKATAPNGSLVINPIVGTVSIKHADGSETQVEVPIKEILVNKPMINVGMSAAHTKNLGNYSSAKISVSLHVPCEAIDLEDTYSFVKDWVNTKMVEVISEIS